MSEKYNTTNDYMGDKHQRSDRVWMGNPGPYVDVRITDFKKEAGVVERGKGEYY